MKDNYIPEAIKPGMSQPMNSKRLLYILNEQKLVCCKIIGSNIGTGFFCKVFLPGTSKVLPVLMTCYHVLNEKNLKIGNKIKITLDDGGYEFNIKIDESKIIYTNPDLDATIIEV